MEIRVWIVLIVVNSVIQLVVLIEWLFVESNNPQSTLLTHHSILQYTLPIHHSLCECFTPLSFISTTISFFHNTISYRSNGEWEWDSLLQFIHSHYKPDSMKANWLIPFELFRFTQNPIGVHSIHSLIALRRKMSQFITILSSLTSVVIDVMIGCVSFLSSTWNDNKRLVDGVEFDESV